MSTNESTQCPIWPEYPATFRLSHPSGEGIIYIKDSPRAGCNYSLEPFGGQALLKEQNLNEEIKAMLTTLLINKHLKGEEFPTVTTQLIDEAKNANRLDRNKRKNRLLKFISTQTQNISDSIELNEEYGHINTLKAMAWTESLVPKDVIYLANELYENGFLNNGDQFRYTITPAGWDFIEEIDKDH